MKFSIAIVIVYFLNSCGVTNTKANGTQLKNASCTNAISGFVYQGQEFANQATVKLYYPNSKEVADEVKSYEDGFFIFLNLPCNDLPYLLKAEGAQGCTGEDNVIVAEVMAPENAEIRLTCSLNLPLIKSR